MTASELVGKRVKILVSDPWEFGTECGVAPFAAVVLAVEADAVLLSLEAPIEYRGARLGTSFGTAATRSSQRRPVDFGGAPRDEPRLPPACCLQAVGRHR